LIRVAASELLHVTAFAYLGKQYDLLVRQKVKMTFFLDTHGLPSGSAIAVTTITTPLCKTSLQNAGSAGVHVEPDFCPAAT
jgi:acid phosphatase family membrane protein YuiD